MATAMQGPGRSILVLLAAAEKLRGALADAVIVFGRVPFFFYLLHLYLIHLAMMLVGVATGFRASDFTRNGFLAAPGGFGFGLPGVYPTRRDWWLSYL